MKDISDILGMELDDAKTLLETEGLVYSIIETKSTKPTNEKGIFRVIKVSIIENYEIKVVVCKI
ncbi:PASTA domain-containing protein [Anaerovorax odorimutans]|uniref:PASTA domain-containing protein n=1 Tax=Anaerovorax odorimutans TaxID=109327 RepID=UPI000413EFFB|nr:PASTA domain-containing protein [Anaerovorax odorimutans]